MKAGAKTWVVLDFGAPIKKAKRINVQIDDPNKVKGQKEGNNAAEFKG